MKLKKNLICMMLASCVAHASVTSQAMLTKDLVIKSTDAFISDSKSDLVLYAENHKQNADTDLKASLELTTTTQEAKATTTEQKEEIIEEIKTHEPITDATSKSTSKQIQKAESAISPTTQENNPTEQTPEKNTEMKSISPTTDSVSKQKQPLDTISDTKKTPLTKSNSPHADDAKESTSDQTSTAAKNPKATTNAKPTAPKKESATKTEQKKVEVQPNTTIADDQEKNTEKQNQPGTKTQAEELKPTAIKDLETQRNKVVKSQEVAKKSTYTDKKYVAEALNLIDPYIYHLTKVAQNFRFCDGSKEKISVNNMEWRYQDDEGIGSANYMKLLFPSNAGELNTDTSAKRECFSLTCKPTAKLIADMECYFHNHVRNPESCDKAQANLITLLKKDINSLRKVLFQTEAKNILMRYEIEIPQGKHKISDYPINDDTIEVITQSKDKDKLVYLHNHLNPKNQISVIDQSALNKLRENIKNGTFDYLSMDHFVKFDEDKKEYKVDSNSFKMVLKLLNEGNYMIKNQEIDEANPEKILPKYMTERMLMVYFFMAKSAQSDITEFYDCVKEKLGENIVDPGSPEEALDKLSKRAKMLQDLKFNDNSPYKVATVENASAYGISKVSDNRNVTFQEQTFQDCADIATRHIINLLMYDKESQWSRLLNGVDRDKLKPALEKILKAIENHKSVEFKTLKERLQIFFLHQERVGADAADTNTRSLWNYAISNMNQEDMEGLYPIEYAGGKNYELASGFDNSLKILYNIAYALDISSSEKRDQAKKAIDDLMKKENHENETKLIDAIQAVHRLFNEKIEVSESSQFKLSSNKLKWIGQVVIKSDTNPFCVEHSEGHSRVTFDPVEKYDFAWIEKNKDYVFKDEIAMLLLGNNIKTYTKLKPISSGVAITEHIFGCNDPNILMNLSKELCDKTPLFYKIYTDSSWNNIYMVERINMEKKIEMKDSSKDYTSCFETLGHKNYISNFKALKFLKRIQGEQNNLHRVNMLYDVLSGINFDSITLKYRIGKQDEKLNSFIITNYLLKAGAMNPENITWGKTLKKINPDAVVEYDGVEYSCLLEGDNATLYPCNVKKSEVTIPAKVSLKGKEYKIVALGAFAFFNSSITKVSFAEGIKSLRINDLAFFECKNLEEINFAESIEKLDLGSGIFGMCSALKSINIPQKVEELNIASGCLGNDQTEIKMPTKLKKLRLETSAFAGSKSLHTFELNDGLEELYVGEYAFGYTSLRSFKVPSSVTDLKIKKDAFRECKQLTELVIPDEKEGIEVSADIRALSDQLKAAKV